MAFNVLTASKKFVSVDLKDGKHFRRESTGSTHLEKKQLFDFKPSVRVRDHFGQFSKDLFFIDLRAGSTVIIANLFQVIVGVV